MNSSFIRSRFLAAIDAVLGLGAPEGQPLHSELPLEISHFLARHHYFSPDTPWICHVTDGREEITESVEFLHRVAAYIDLPEEREWVGGEILAKLFAYRNLQKGDRIPILESEGLRFYIVETLFSLWGGFPAFGLMPEQDGTPLLLFRGTDLTWHRRSGLASIWSDLDPRGPGFSLYQRYRPGLRAWLEGKKARAIGHSLGGALASYTVLFEGGVLSTARPSIAYNPPGVSSQVARLFKERPLQTKLLALTTEGDHISAIGNIVGEIRHLEPPVRLRPIEAHVSLATLFCPMTP